MERSRRNKSAMAAGLAVLSLSLASCGESLGGESGGAEGGPLKVGLIVALSGNLAVTGVDMRDGFNLYLESKGGELGGREVDLTIVDEGNGPQTGVPAASRLVNVEQVDIAAGVTSSAVGIGLRSVYAESETPILIANASSRQITEPVSPYIWRTSFTNTEMAAAAARAVQKEQPEGSMYVLAPDYAAGHEVAGGFVENYRAAGGKIVDEVYTPFGTTSDWQPYLNNIRNSGATAVYAYYAGSEAVNFVKQWESFGLGAQMPLYVAGFTVAGDVLEAEGESALGIKSVLHYSDAIDTPENEEFVEAYLKEFGKYPSSFAEQGYATALVIDQAVENAADLSGPELSKAIEELGDIESPRGTWSFDEDHNPTQPYYFLEVRQEDDGRIYNEVLEKIADK